MAAKNGPFKDKKPEEDLQDDDNSARCETNHEKMKSEKY